MGIRWVFFYCWFLTNLLGCLWFFFMAHRDFFWLFNHFFFFKFFGGSFLDFFFFFGRFFKCSSGCLVLFHFFVALWTFLVAPFSFSDGPSGDCRVVIFVLSGSLGVRCLFGGSSDGFGLVLFFSGGFLVIFWGSLAPFSGCRRCVGVPPKCPFHIPAVPTISSCPSVSPSLWRRPLSPPWGRLHCHRDARPPFPSPCRSGPMHPVVTTLRDVAVMPPTTSQLAFAAIPRPCPILATSRPPSPWCHLRGHRGRFHIPPPSSPGPKRLRFGGRPRPLFVTPLVPLVTFTSPLWRPPPHPPLWRCPSSVP